MIVNLKFWFFFFAVLGLLIKCEGESNVDTQNESKDSEVYQYEAEVNRMMKMIINSLYKTKDIFLRELISNASDALDKIRLLALTNSKILEHFADLAIRISADKENNLLHIIDTGVGMTKQELITNLGTIAKSGTAEFLKSHAEDSDGSQFNDLIGQFGVGFYASFLVADKVTVVSKSYLNSSQWIWESDSKAFTITEDTDISKDLKRGTQVTLHLKEEAKNFLEVDVLRDAIKKYSQFINFPIYLWSSKIETTEEPIDESQSSEEVKNTDKDNTVEDAVVEEAEKKEKEEAKVKKVDKTVWDWELVNVQKPIWTRKRSEVTGEDYNDFCKALTKDKEDPLSKIHFTAEGEVTFKSILCLPKFQPSEQFNKYGMKTQSIRMYVRRVFITDDLGADILPNYLSFVHGVVDSDDLPLNVSRETLQQHKLLKIIKKKLIRKIFEMFKAISEADYGKFWSEYSTNIKLGIIEDSYNRNRLAKFLRFHSSNLPESNFTSLDGYIERMKPNQEHIFYLAGKSLKELETSPFVEALRKKGYEVLYLVDAVDEYTITSLTDYEGKNFQNVAKDGLDLSKDGNKEKLEYLNKNYEPLLQWFEKEVLPGKVLKVTLSQRLHESPCALVASQFGWTGNMERLARSNAHTKSKDVTLDFYLSQKKVLEINPKHPIIKELLKRVVAGEQKDKQTIDAANLLFENAVIRSGYYLEDTASYASKVETLLKKSLGVSENESIEEDEDDINLNEDQKKENANSESHDEL